MTGILNKALGRSLVPELAKTSESALRKQRVSKYSLKFFARDDSMYSKPESIRASLDNEVRKFKIKQKKDAEMRQKDQLRLKMEHQNIDKRPAVIRAQNDICSKRREWILKDDLD